MTLYARLRLLPIVFIASTACSSGGPASTSGTSSPRTCTAAYGASIVDGRPVSTYVCWNGVETSCSALPADGNCGCGCDSTSYCKVADDRQTASCTPLDAIGKACVGDWSCASGNCSLTQGDGGSKGQGLCSVAIGSVCDKTTCAECIVPAGKTKGVCSSRCTILTSDTSGQTDTCSKTAGREACVGGYCWMECSNLVPQPCPDGLTCSPYLDAAGYIAGTACTDGVDR